MTENQENDEERDAVVAEVVAIIDSRELIIDAGQEDGVEIGMRFAILGTVVVDAPRAPSGKLEVPFPKTIVKIVRFLDENHSVGRTFRVIKGRPAIQGALASFTAPSLRALEGTPATADRVESLKVSDGTPTLVSELDEDDRKIKVGDTAEETWGDEYTEQ